MRKGALPKRIQKTLTCENAIHTLDNSVQAAQRSFYVADVAGRYPETEKFIG